jgi:hypothetical protein
MEMLKYQVFHRFEDSIGIHEQLSNPLLRPSHGVNRGSIPRGATRKHCAQARETGPFACHRASIGQEGHPTGGFPWIRRGREPGQGARRITAPRPGVPSKCSTTRTSPVLMVIRGLSTGIPAGYPPEMLTHACRCTASRPPGAHQGLSAPQVAAHPEEPSPRPGKLPMVQPFGRTKVDPPRSLGRRCRIPGRVVDKPYIVMVGKKLRWGWPSVDTLPQGSRGWSRESDDQWPPPNYQEENPRKPDIIFSRYTCRK